MQPFHDAGLREGTIDRFTSVGHKHADLSQIALEMVQGEDLPFAQHTRTHQDAGNVVWSSCMNPGWRSHQLSSVKKEQKKKESNADMSK